MAFATQRSTAVSGNSGANATNHVVTLPATISAGDFMIVVFGNDGSSTVSGPAGWTNSFSAVNGSVCRVSVITKTAVGGEGGTTIQVGTAFSEGAAWIAMVWRGDQANSFSISSEATGTTANPNAANYTPSWGSKDTVWISACVWDGNASHTTYPSGMTSVATDRWAHSNGCGVAAAYINSTGASYDPASHTISASKDWVAAVIAIEPTGGVTGTSAQTLSAATSTATGTVLNPVTGTSAQTLSAATSTATGTQTFTGTAAVTLQAATSTATGTQTFTGTAAVTLQAATSTATGTTGDAVTGTATPTLGAATSAATGTLTVTGSAAVTLQAATSAATGTLTVTGSAAVTLQAATSAATGTLTVTGTAAPSLAAATSAASGTQTFTGSAATTLAAATAASTGSLTYTGSAASTLQPATSSSSGSQTFTGTSASLLNPATAVGSGVVTVGAVTGSSSASTSAATSAATGLVGVTITGAGAPTLRPARSAASGLIPEGAGTDDGIDVAPSSGLIARALCRYLTDETDLPGHAAYPFARPQIVDGMTCLNRNDARRFLRSYVSNHVYANRIPQKVTAHTAVVVGLLARNKVQPLVGEVGVVDSTLSVSVIGRGASADHRTTVAGSLLSLAISDYRGWWHDTYIHNVEVMRDEDLAEQPIDGSDDWRFIWSTDVTVGHDMVSPFYSTYALTARVVITPRDAGTYVLSARGSLVPGGVTLASVYWFVRDGSGTIVLEYGGRPNDTATPVTASGTNIEAAVSALPSEAVVEVYLTDSTGTTSMASGDWP